MTEPDSYSYSRYLTAKKTVDARALDRQVWSEFVGSLAGRSGASTRILEVGAGVGATAERVIGALEKQSVDAVDYTLVDIEAENIEVATASLRAWMGDHGYTITGEGGVTRSVWNGEALTVTFRFATADLFDFVAERERSLYDAIIGQALFDLLPAQEALRALGTSLKEGGLWYLPIHFDGVTAFEPTIDAGLDAKIERLYHESMTEAAGKEGGPDGPRCGRRLLTHLRNAGAVLREAGASDWVVFAREDGYPGDEAYFLHHVLHFIENELRGHPALDPDVFTNWIAERRHQIDDGELIYIAHQLDVLARNP
ncbi:MAG: class I SAM-dependent methyltransferase [Salinibacter sp.]|uniref:class I SAM-dependent methyltransferase n=1 Tax=Salinibacter sp. TaxID=2065818 RepID=UPI0035D3FB9C